MSHSGKDFQDLQIGVVFTPLLWGQFACEQMGILEDWLAGATIFDPTMGRGHLLESLIQLGLAQGYELAALPTERLFGNELNRANWQAALDHFDQTYGLDMSSQFTQADLLDLPARAFDWVLGNPPWGNFVDQPESYKPKLKKAFEAYDLIKDRRDLLLGGARIDIAALIIQRVMRDFLVPSGQACFFMPLSLLLNEGASTAFRTYQVGEQVFAPEVVYDLAGTQAFGEVMTRYGLVRFKRDRLASFPIPYYRFEENLWQEWDAKPLLAKTDALSIYQKGTDALAGLQPIRLHKASKPRQGLNTGGANAVFFIQDPQHALGSALPSEYVYPLLVRENFKEQSLKIHKWVILPYDRSGKPLSQAVIQGIPPLWHYLLSHEATLKARKGKMLGSWLRRGYWWALLGVGPYNFAPYKVVWEAYGRKEFRPMLVVGNWQVNQALQAYIPVPTKAEGERILKALQQPTVEAYLHSQLMAGTMNWAQPGKIKKLIEFID